MPLVPFHGWLADGYKAMPIPAVAVFSAILSKVAAYGFLRIVLPLFPYASQHYQTLMLLIALVSILWATALAFTTPDARLVVAYSSVAQLGFITLGIFSLRPEGAQGALLQMVNHALVTAPAFFIVAALAARVGGSEQLRDMGGIAFRAPVLASLFLIVAFAKLAMPGSSNFVGEFMILLGVFKSKLAISVIAFSGVVGAAFYALRLFIASMHNRLGPNVDSREIGIADAVAIVPFVLVILVLAFYPSSCSGGREPTVSVAAASCVHRRWRHDDRARRRRPDQGPAHRLGGAVADHGAGGGGLVLLLVGLLRSAVVRERVIPVLAIVGFAAMLGCAIWRFDHPASIVSDALAVDDLALTLDMLFAVAGIATVLLSWDGVASRDAGHGEYHSLLLFSAMGMAVFVSAQNLVTLFVGIELLSIPLYVLCASESRREHSLESGLKYLVIGSVGSATLAYGLALIYGATGSTDFSGIADAIAHGKLGVGIAGDPMLLTGLGLAIVGLCVQGVGGAVSPVDAGRLRGRADADHRVHGDRDQGRRAGRVHPLLRHGRVRRPRQVGAAAGRGGRDHDDRRQRRRAGPVLAQADARLLGRRAGRLHARRRGRRQPSSGSRPRCCTCSCTWR